MAHHLKHDDEMSLPFCTQTTKSTMNVKSGTSLGFFMMMIFAILENILKFLRVENTDHIHITRPREFEI